jgi:hypothetical protein
MTVKEWHESFGDEVIFADGRGGCSIRTVDNMFSAILSDEQLTRKPYKPGESQTQWIKRMELEDVDSFFRPDQDIMDVVNWFLDQVAYSTEDREHIVSAWKKQTGQE